MIMREALTDIVNDANRASTIIARIRAMTTRALPGKTSLQLREVIGEVLALARRELAERRIEVRTELPEDLPRVFGDRIQLQQVLLNLVMNGIEAMSGVAGERRLLTIGGQRDGLDGRPSVRISVQDLGSGIEAENMNISLRHSIPLSRRAWGWDCGSAAPSWKPTAGVCGLRRMLAQARRSFSLSRLKVERPLNY